MKQGLLLICTCLMALLCTAQEQLIPDVPAADSSYIITDVLAVVKENTKVLVNWRMARPVIHDFITIERSNNGREFEVVAILKQTMPSGLYDWPDEAAPKGRNVYRIRYADSSGLVYYSKTAAVLIAGDISFRFYPNPVDNILIIRTEVALDIQIMDASGRIRISQPKLQGLQTINVSALEKGIYYLLVNNRVTNTLSQERLLKN